MRKIFGVFWRRIRYCFLLIGASGGPLILLALMAVTAMSAGCVVAPLPPQPRTEVRFVLPDPPVYVHDANRPCSPPKVDDVEKWATELEPGKGESGTKNKHRSAQVVAGSFGLDCTFRSNSSSSTTKVTTAGSKGGK